MKIPFIYIIKDLFNLRTECTHCKKYFYPKENTCSFWGGLCQKCCWYEFEDDIAEHQEQVYNEKH